MRTPTAAGWCTTPTISGISNGRGPTIWKSEVAELMNEGTAFVVVHAEVDYRSPACYGDRLIVETVVSEVTAASFTFSHVIRERESRRVVVEGSAKLAATDRGGKVKRLDKAVVAVIQSEITRSR